MAYAQLATAHFNRRDIAEAREAGTKAYALRDRVTELEPGRSFTWKSGAPGMRVYARHSVTPSGNGSRAVLSLRYEGTIGRLFARLTRGITDRYLGYEAAGLKRRSEERAGSSGPSHPPIADR